MTGRRGIRRQSDSTGTSFGRFGQNAVVSDDQYRKDRGHRGPSGRVFKRPSPSILPAWVDVHAILFTVLVIAFVVWPAAQWVPPGSGLPALLYSGKRVCRPPGGRGGAGEGYVGRSGSLGSSMGSIWATAWPRTGPFGGVHVQSGVRKGPPASDLCSTD